jgi:hypothetical protein
MILPINRITKTSDKNFATPAKLDAKPPNPKKAQTTARMKNITM